MNGWDISVRIRTVVLAAAVVGLAATGMTGCSTTKPGTPTPTSGASTGDDTTGAPAVSDDWWRSVNACGLLDQGTATSLGYPQPGQIQEGNKQDCAWTAADGSTVTVVLEGQAYDSGSADMGQQSRVTVAGRPAVQNAQIGGSPHGCGLAIQATKGSDAFIDVETLNSTVPEACSLAQSVGTAIAPKLPSIAK